MPGRPLLLAAAGLAAIAVTLALSVQRHTSRTRTLPLAPLSVLGRLRDAPPAGCAGRRRPPVPAATPLAAPRPLHVGQRIDGIACESGEQVAFHIHAHLRIVVAGRSRRVPAGIGIAAPYQVAARPSGPFVAGGSCFMWLHTHAADGIVHVESPVDRTYTLGNFDVWGQPLTRRRVGPAGGRVTALFDGRVFSGNLRTIPLLAHSEIELEVGHPLVASEHIAFPGSRVEMIWRREFTSSSRGRVFGTLFRRIGKPIFGRYARETLENLRQLEQPGRYSAFQTGYSDSTI